jgi:hypothetical protein
MALSMRAASVSPGTSGGGNGFICPIISLKIEIESGRLLSGRTVADGRS